MQIRIIVEDRLVALDNRPVEILDLAWQKFAGDPASPWDDIFAVQFDTDAGQGHVEYREVATNQVSRPNMRPPDWRIGVRDFEDNFAWVLPFYHARKAEIEADEAAKADALAKMIKDAEAADLVRRQAEADAHNARLLNPDAAQAASPLPADAVTRTELADVLADNERLKATVEKLDAFISGMVENAEKISGGET